jgi:predicted nucleic acid-binding Zn ribbon protein
MCDAEFTGPGFLVEAVRSRGSSRWWIRVLICEPCYRVGCPTVDGHTVYAHQDTRRRHRFEWMRLVGRGPEQPPAPCAACGRVLVRGADPLLKRVTCSHSCSTSLTRKRNGNQGGSQPCDICGKAITTGRADSRYCGSACRQKGYRQRQATQAALATPLLDARGRRYPQRSQRKALESGVATLSGLCEAFARTGVLEGVVRPSELDQWRTELAAAQQVVEALHGKLRVRSGSLDTPADIVPAPSRPATRKNLAQGTAALSGLCAGLAGVTELSEEITPELAGQWQAQTGGALAGIGRIMGVLDSHSRA